MELVLPLLIYTGKILQDYQNGLGVFVSKDEMRFVSNGDAKHDILNIFSSGQLSGFVLAFLFAMNKQYIKASSDAGLWEKDFSSGIQGYNLAYELLMEFVAKHTSDKFCLIDNVNTSIRGIITREVIANILVYRDYSSAFPAKVIAEIFICRLNR